MNSSLQRIPRVEFFAVLPAGLWILASISFVWAAAVDFRAGSKGADFFTRVAPLFEGMKSIPVALAVILLAYLLGHIPRAIGLDLADRICERWLRPWAGGSSARPRRWAREALIDTFPYRRMLERTLTNVLGPKAKLKDSEQDEKGRPPVFTFHEMWKTTVRQLSADGYAHLESLEARARMYAALFWAGMFGALCGLTALVTVTTAFVGWGALALAFGVAFILFGHWYSEYDHRQSDRARASAQALGRLGSPRWLVATLAIPLLIGIAWAVLHRVFSYRSWLIDTGSLLAFVVTAWLTRNFLDKCCCELDKLSNESGQATEAGTNAETNAERSARLRLIHNALAILTGAAFIYIAAEPALPLKGVTYSVWLRPAVALVLGSITLAAALGARLRTVRAEESEKVLLAYLACVTDKKGALKPNLIGITMGSEGLNASGPGGEPTSK